MTKDGNSSMQMPDEQRDLRDDHAPGLAGSAYWRGVEEYAESAEFKRRLSEEFPDYDPEALRKLSRRSILKYAAASMALAGLTMTGCRRWPKENIVPYAARPEGKIPGEPEHYASVFELDGVAQPVLVKSFDGRPIKVEGNPDHPGCRGASTKYAQASVLDLYDPSRARTVTTGRGDPPESGTWRNFQTLIDGRFARLRAGGEAEDRAGTFAVLAQPQSGPTYARLKAAMLERYPNMGWYEYSPLHRHHVEAGTKQALGEARRPQYRVESAAVIACFDCDLLESEPDALNHAWGWAEGRRSADRTGQMNRLYAVEPGFSVTGSVADERLAVKPSRVMTVLTAVAEKLGVLTGNAANGSLNGDSAFVERLVKDLHFAEGQSLVVAGSQMPAEAHALCVAINAELNNVGRTVRFSP